MDANPYNPLQPTTDPDRLYGREDVFAFFRQHLVGTPHEHALVLIGRFGLGRTSILVQLDRQLDDRYVLCVAGLSAADCDSEELFFAALMDEIRLAMEDAEASTYRLPDWPPDDEPDAPLLDLRTWFRDQYLDVALAALRTRHLVLVLDNMSVLLDAIDQGMLPVDLLDALTGMLRAYPRLDMIAVLDEADEDRALSIDLLSNPALHIRITELAHDAAARLVNEPIERLCHYASGLDERILALGGGHPYLLHSICRLLFRRSEERNHAGPITDLDLTAIHDAVIEQAGDVFDPLWQPMAHNERLTLAALIDLLETGGGEPVPLDQLYERITATGYALNKTQLAAALRSLGYKGLIRPEADTYSLSAGLLASWVKTTAPDLLPQAVPARVAGERSRPGPLLGLLAVVAIIAGLGIAALAGVFDSDEQDASPDLPSAPTATLSLNLEATRQADSATQTEQARPTATPTRTLTPTDTLTPSDTPTPALTNTPTATDRPTATDEPTATDRPTATDEPTATDAPTATRTPRPTRTDTAVPPSTTPPPTATRTSPPTRPPTLDPGD